MSTSPAIRAERLTKRYRRRKGEPIVALDGLTLEATTGEMLALLGPNGSGKSTLMRLVTGAQRSDEGSLAVLGVEAGRATRDVRRRLAVVFQSPGLDALLTVRENLLTQCALFGWSGADARTRAHDYAERVGLTDRLGDRVGGLSGGLKRRTDLARALLSEPELLLLDEPTTGLDPEARASFLDLIGATRRERPSMTIIMSTHLMDEADRADRVALLSEGRLIAHASPDELRASLGDLAIHAGVDHAETLRGMGLEVRTHEDRVVGAGDLEALSDAAQRLASEGVPFALSPPTLEDVYLAHAGAGAGGAR